MIKSFYIFFLLLLSYDVFAYEFKPDIYSKDKGKLRDLLKQDLVFSGELSRKSVVYVSTKGLEQPWLKSGLDKYFNPGSGEEKAIEGIGSGFIVDLAKGYIITNEHVVKSSKTTIVRLANGFRYHAKILGQDSRTDVAVIQIKNRKFNKKDLSELRFRNSDTLKLGEKVFALGNPHGLATSMSSGIISATERHIPGKLGSSIQIDASVNPGNSGGPLLDLKGNLIGMNSFIYSKSGGFSGIAFAVPANVIRLVAEQIINKGSFTRGFLGVHLAEVDWQSLPKDIFGAVKITSVEEKSPAKKQGLLSGDKIYKINDEYIESKTAAANVVGTMLPGEMAVFSILRKGKKKQVKIKLSKPL